MHRADVVHKDVREPNLLYNPETKSVMIIDFERSALVEQPSDDAKPEEKRIVAVGRDSRVVPDDAREDMLMAKWVFSMP